MGPAEQVYDEGFGGRPLGSAQIADRLTGAFEGGEGLGKRVGLVSEAT